LVGRSGVQPAARERRPGGGVKRGASGEAFTARKPADITPPTTMPEGGGNATLCGSCQSRRASPGRSGAYQDEIRPPGSRPGRSAGPRGIDDGRRGRPGDGVADDAGHTRGGRERRAKRRARYFVEFSRVGAHTWGGGARVLAITRCCCLACVAPSRRPARSNSDGPAREKGASPARKVESCACCRERSASPRRRRSGPTRAREVPAEGWSFGARRGCHFGPVRIRWCLAVRKLTRSAQGAEGRSWRQVHTKFR